MEVIFTLLGLFVFIVIFAVVGHGVWVVLAAIVRTFSGISNPSTSVPTTNSAENDLAQSYLAIDRLYRGKVISIESFQQSCSILEKAAVQQGIVLPWIPSKHLVSNILAQGDASAEAILNSSTETIESVPFTSDMGHVSTMQPEAMVKPSQEIHPLEQEYSPSAPPLIDSIASQTRKTLGNVLQQFLSEKNIHWGELVSAMLIVGSAVGLILSLRTELNRLIPMFPSVLFFLVTLAIHLAGFYTLKRWKLPSTSRGLLVLGAVMMCVTSLATVLLTEQSSAPVHALVPIVAGLIGFGVLSHLSSASLFPGMRPLWTIAVSLSAVAPLLLGHWLEPEIQLDQLKWASNITVVGPLIAIMGLMVYHFGFRKRGSSISLRSQLRLLGITFVGSLFAGGLILFLLRGTPGGLMSLSLMLSVLGGLMVCAGSIISFESNDQESRVSAELSDSLIDRVSVIGSAISFLGAGVMVLSLGSAWNSSSLFLETACFNAIVSIILVLLWRHPTLTAIASAFGTVSCWLLVHRLSGNFPAPNMQWGWLLRAMETVRSSGTFLVLAGIFGGIALNSSYRHQVILFVAGALTGMAGLGIAGYLGCTATALGPHAYSIVCFALVGSIVVLFCPIRARMEPAVIGSVFLLFSWFMLARPSTEISARWGINTSFVEDFAAFTLSGHAITTVLIASAVSLTRRESIGVRVLPLVARRLREPRMEHWISDTGLVSAAVCTPLLIRIEPSLHWIWQASVLAILAVCCWAGWMLGRGNARESLGWFVSGCSLCFFLALGFDRVFPTGVLVSSSLSIAIACVVFLGTLCSIYFLRPTRIACSKIKLKAWGTSYGDGLLITVSLLFLAHWLVESRDWWQAVLYSRANASVWTVSLVLLFLCAITLTAVRRRSLYIWLTGGMSTIVVFTMFGIWSPQGGDEVAFVYLLLGAPQLVAGIASAIDVFQRKQPLSGLSTKGRYESVVAQGTIFCWIVVTWLGYLGNLESPTTRACGLWSPVGALWVTVGLTSFWLGSHVVLRRLFVAYFLTGSLFVSLNLPIAITRTFATKLDVATTLSLMIVGVTLQIFIVSFYVLRGDQIPSFVRRYLKQDEQAGQAEAIRLCWNYSNLMGLGLGLLCLLVAIESTNPEVVRLQALAVSLLAFANGLLVRRATEETSPAALPLIPALLNRYLMVIFISLFMLFAVWARLESLDTSILISKRVLRAAAIVVATIIGLGFAYAWLRRSEASKSTNEVEPTSRESSAIGSSFAFLRDFSSRKSIDRSIRESWPQTLGNIWIGATFLALLFLFGGFVAILATTSAQFRAVSELIEKRNFAVEAIWIALLTGIWAAHLIVQALRTAWNIAQFPDSLRSLYVYIAEVAVVLAGAILVSIFPEWFRLPMREYWPILMLVTAAVVQGVAMMLKQAGVSAVGDPLHNTSLLIPLVAPLAMLFIATDASLEMVLALGAVFYFFLGATERSRNLAMIGGTFANGALLSFWNRFESLDFAEHPQLWLIPPAASIVLATHVERDRIPKEAASWLRYLCMATIFCSSSSEILIQGLGRSLWPPMVLMVLSLLVGFLGIAFQVKSYLYSSLLFTLFAVVAMVAHAQQSVQHTWPWWVLGISLGIGIMVLFAMFERKRDQLTKLSERLRSWE
ncbi:MAG: hypothetical protein ACK5PB_11695 [Pirellula sp.]